MCLGPFLVVPVVVHPSATALRLCSSPSNPRFGDKHILFSAPSARSYSVWAKKQKRSDTMETDEVRKLIEQWAASVRVHNLDNVLKDHAPDLLMFDVIGQV
jgi:hypothetical protein